MMVASLRDQHPSHVLLLLHIRTPKVSAGGFLHFSLQNIQSLSSFSSLNPSVKDDPHQRANTNLPKSRQNILKSCREATSTGLSMSPRQLRSRTEDLMLSPDSLSHRHKVQLCMSYPLHSAHFSLQKPHHSVDLDNGHWNGKNLQC